MGFELELPAELEREAVAHDEQVEVSNVIATSPSEFLTRQRWDELKTWLAEQPSEWPAEWETEELDELLAGISEDNLHKEIDFGPPVGAEVRLAVTNWPV